MAKHFEYFFGTSTLGRLITKMILQKRMSKVKCDFKMTRCASF